MSDYFRIRIEGQDENGMGGNVIVEMRVPAPIILMDDEVPGVSFSDETDNESKSYLRMQTFVAQMFDSWLLFSGYQDHHPERHAALQKDFLRFVHWTGAYGDDMPDPDAPKKET